MSTRNLTVVVSGGAVVIAQYGHFDGYPSGVGKSLLALLRQDSNHIIQSRLPLCKELPQKEYLRFVNDRALDEDALQKVHPNFWWSDGPALITMLLDNPQEAEILLETDFAGDSIQCAWCYVIDYDQQRFEVYKGWNTTPLKESARFYTGKTSKDGFYPVKLVEAFSLNALPTMDEFSSKEWFV